jgi:hypothetical protein
LPLSKADDAGWIIAIAGMRAKRPTTDGMFGPMSGASSGKLRLRSLLVAITRSLSFRGDPVVEPLKTSPFRGDPKG